MKASFIRGFLLDAILKSSLNRMFPKTPGSALRMHEPATTVAVCERQPNLK